MRDHIEGTDLAPAIWRERQAMTNKKYIHQSGSCFPSEVPDYLGQPSKAVLVSVHAKLAVDLASGDKSSKRCAKSLAWN
jgi:hypothetical protein